AGLRVDHPDGLAGPAGSLRRLRDAGVGDVWVEQILHPGERLRDWPVAGTVGYEFLNDVAALYVDPAGEEALTALWVELTGDGRSFAEVAYEAQLEQATTTFAREIEWLRSLADLPGVAETLAALPVYRYNRLLALNEVGGDPARFGISVDELHAGNAERARRFPRGLLALSTHDTKRSADVRARIGALAGMAAEWRERVLRWRTLNEPLRDEAPDAGEEYLLYQTLVGAWPISRDRLERYVEKALREAKRTTSWVEQNHAYEERVKAFAAALLDHGPFLDDFLPFAERVAVEGERQALGQVLLLLTAP